MSRERWRAVVALAVVFAVAGALAGVLLGTTWAPAAALGVLAIAALMREPPQGGREWGLVLALVVGIGLLAVALTAGAR